MQGGIADYERAMRLAPGDASLPFVRGLLFYQAEDYDRAIADYTRAIEIHPKEAQYHIERALAHVAKNDFKAAQADYAMAAKLDPNNSETISQICIAALSPSGPAGAVEKCPTAINKRPSRQR